MLLLSQPFVFLILHRSSKVLIPQPTNDSITLKPGTMFCNTPPDSPANVTLCLTA